VCRKQRTAHGVCLLQTLKPCRWIPSTGRALPRRRLNECSPVLPRFAALATRVCGWTTKGLLTALVIVAGLGVGRQVLVWWRQVEPVAEPGNSPVTVGDGLGDLSRPHVLQFGSSPWSLGRQSVRGSQEAVTKTLREACRQAVRSCPLPPDPMTDAEKTFLATLAARQPAEQEGDTWRLYQLSGDFPVVVGTRQVAADSKAAPAGAVAVSAYRMVTGE